MMDNPSPESADADLTIDAMPPCDCCSYTGINWKDFLEAFPENLPEPGKRVLLRVHEPTMTGVGLLLRCCANEH